ILLKFFPGESGVAPRHGGRSAKAFERVPETSPTLDGFLEAQPPTQARIGTGVRSLGRSGDGGSPGPGRLGSLLKGAGAVQWIGQEGSRQARAAVVRCQRGV